MRQCDVGDASPVRSWYMPDERHLPAVKRLAPSQLLTYDREYVSDHMHKNVMGLVEGSFPTGRFTFLDVGGGNGLFCDGLLRRFPYARGTLLDNAGVLLARNRPHPRKAIVHGNAENLNAVFSGRSFDVVFLNRLLHHCVSATYAGTRRLQRHVLLECRKVLSLRGRISVLERLYDGLFADGLPSMLIFLLTSSTVLAPVTRRLGANTAGCGVCFLSRRECLETFRCCGLELATTPVYKRLAVEPVRYLALHIGSEHVGHFWLSPRSSVPAATHAATPR